MKHKQYSPDDNLIELAESLLFWVENTETNKNAIRGLDYYKSGKGFEISKGGLQLCGGGAYDNGLGFAIGIDRLI